MRFSATLYSGGDRFLNSSCICNVLYCVQKSTTNVDSHAAHALFHPAWVWMSQRDDIACSLSTKATRVSLSYFGSLTISKHLFSLLFYSKPFEAHKKRNMCNKQLFNDHDGACVKLRMSDNFLPPLYILGYCRRSSQVKTEIACVF